MTKRENETSQGQDAAHQTPGVHAQDSRRYERARGDAGSAADGLDGLEADKMEEVFATARMAQAASHETASADLMARVLADAMAHQPSADQSSPVPPRLVWQGLRETLGGWAGLGGLALAGVTGLALGLGSPGVSGVNWTTELAAFSDDVGDELALDPLALFDVGLLFEESDT